MAPHIKAQHLIATSTKIFKTLPRPKAGSFLKLGGSQSKGK
jgi:hypothetical protein